MSAHLYYKNEILRNGLEVVVRASRPEDAEDIVEAFEGLEDKSIYTRFFSFKKEITEAELQRLREVDFDTRVTLLCIIERDGEETVIASGTYAKVAEDSAEVAFIVEEDYQRHGISKLLLTHLREIAIAGGIKTFTAEVLPSNAAMLGVFKSCGWPMKSRTSGGTVQITLNLEHS
jgi:RimJ/RimL family protein N-acetyltransferase